MSDAPPPVTPEVAFDSRLALLKSELMQRGHFFHDADVMQHNEFLFQVVGIIAAHACN
jgi:hypothetical protein